MTVRDWQRANEQDALWALVSSRAVCVSGEHPPEGSAALTEFSKNFYSAYDGKV